MKIVVTNQQGRIGKSILAANVFLPFSPADTRFFSIESQNTGAEQYGVELTKIRGRDTVDLLSAVIAAENAVVDVGASNFEPFFQGLAEFSAVSDFDLFVVPTVPGGKRESLETMKTVAQLRAFGVPASRIHIVFNMVEVRDLDEPLEKATLGSFREIFAIAKEEKSCVANPKAALRKSNVFDHLGRTRKTLADAMLDETDYSSALKEAAADPQEFARVKNAFAAMRMAKVLAADCKALYDLVTAGIEK